MFRPGQIVDQQVGVGMLKNMFFTHMANRWDKRNFLRRNTSHTCLWLLGTTTDDTSHFLPGPSCLYSFVQIIFSSSTPSALVPSYRCPNIHKKKRKKNRKTKEKQINKQKKPYTHTYKKKENKKSNAVLLGQLSPGVLRKKASQYQDLSGHYRHSTCQRRCHVMGWKIAVSQL